MSDARDAPSTGRHLWDNMALRLLHPTQLLIIESLSHIARPLSPSLLEQIMDGEISLNLLDYHCKRLASLGILMKANRRPVRGAWENFYWFSEV